MASILSFGAYVPRLRMQRQSIYVANRWFAPGLRGLAKGERAMANWDEDVVTMAVEAARDCLSERNRSDISAVLLASTSFPYLDRQNAGIVKEALNLDDRVSTLDVGMSQKAGIDALVEALLAAPVRTKPTLVIGSEVRRAKPASEDELTNGDGATAFLVGETDGIARLVAHHSLSIDLVDHFRAEGEAFDSNWEARWVKEKGLEIVSRALKGALDAAGLSGGDIDHLAVGVPGRGVGRSIAKACGLKPEAVCDDLSQTLGHAGTAHALVQFALALENAGAGQKIAVIGFGQGATVAIFETTDALTEYAARPLAAALARKEPELNYMKFLAFTGNLKLELGKRAEFDQKPVLTALYRNRKAVMGLVGGRCTRTGTVQFPRSEISVSQNDPAVGTQEDYPLAEKTARILTFTADSLTYTPDPPNFYGMVEFDGGGRMLAEFTDCNADMIEVGSEMRMMFRIKAVDNHSGFVKYFWKAVPVTGEHSHG